MLDEALRSRTHAVVNQAGFVAGHLGTDHGATLAAVFNLVPVSRTQRRYIYLIRYACCTIFIYCQIIICSRWKFEGASW